jgi:hypothetical protein
MHLDDFEIRTVTFELRYERNYQHWDRAGRFWQTWLKNYPDTQLATANPNDIVFAGSKLRAQSGIERSHIMFSKPGLNLKEFIPAAASFTETLTEVLEISSFRRIGFRVIYARRYPSIREATDAVLSLGLLKTIPPESFGIEEGHAHLPEYANRLEGPGLGVMFRIKAQEMNVSLEPPAELSDSDMVAIKSTFQEVVLDIDYYTTSVVLLSQFRTKDWLEAAYHAIRRDSPRLIGGINV